MTILIGTSGFSYDDWVGPVYPADPPKTEWLRFYAQEFPTCELNFTLPHTGLAHPGPDRR